METKTQQPSGTVPVRTALFTGVVFAVAMLLLNGSAMLRSARNLEAGTLHVFDTSTITVNSDERSKRSFSA